MIVLNSADQLTMNLIHRDEFPLPDLSDPMYISCKTVIDKGVIQAIGLARLTTEGILITNQSLPFISRAKASVAVMDALRKDLLNKKIHECHVFVKEQKVQKFLEHYGFKESLGGKPLIIFF